MTAVFSRLLPYLRIARPDHWLKNVFMVLGIVLALFYRPAAASADLLLTLGAALISVCLVASSNYVINEVIDGPRDALHPVKRLRPVPAGLVNPRWAFVEWIALGTAGLALASRVNAPFAWSAAWLLGMGLLYNVPPVRLKDLPYLDVLSESINNAIRLYLGWFTVIGDRLPPFSLVIAYWMLGAFFMATKRLAEYRRIGDKGTAAAYRTSFAYYDEGRLLVSILFYAVTCSLFAGIFIVRYRLELLLFAPLLAGVFALYLRLGLRPDSAAQYPERLFRERGLMAFLALAAVVFVLLMFVEVPLLYRLFDVEPAGTRTLWSVGR
jgi:4-hydroxybenzoate polyprenyltransferase